MAAYARILMPALFAACICFSNGVHAQNFPSKPIRFLIGFTPSGSADIIARGLGQKLSESLGQPVVIENRAGANGVIASELLARAAPDGHTIMLNTTGHAINPALVKLNFDSLKDFAFVSRVADSANLLVVHPSFPATSVKTLIALSRAHPGAITYGSQGTGATGHLSGELFQFMTGVKWVHVPYKGGAMALSDLLGGQISLQFGNIPTVIQHARAGKLRPLAVTGAKRSAAAPEIPTVAESGVAGFEVNNWFGVSVPSKTPPEIIDRLHAEIVGALKSAELRAALSNAGADPAGTTPAQYTEFVQSEIAKWGRLIRAAGIGTG